MAIATTAFTADFSVKVEGEYIAFYTEEGKAISMPEFRHGVTTLPKGARLTRSFSQKNWVVTLTQGGQRFSFKGGRLLDVLSLAWEIIN